MSCGDTIIVDTRPANDLSDCPGNGIIIGAENVTPDLDGGPRLSQSDTNPGGQP